MSDTWKERATVAENMRAFAEGRCDAALKEIKLLRYLLQRAYDHHTAVSLPLVVERFGSSEMAKFEGQKLWMIDIPVKLSER